MECVYKKTGFLFKFLPCLLATIVVFMTLYGSFVYASTVNDNGTDISVPDFSDIVDDYNHYVISRGIDSYTNNVVYYLVCSSSESIPYIENNCLYFHQPYYFYRISNDTWENTFSVGGDSYSNALTLSNTSYVIYTSNDIIDVSTNEVVFHSPTQEVGIIAEQTQGVQMDKILQEILGILPIVLVVIVGILAIRKAIQFLMVILKKS